MKKILSGMMALAMLFATSCQNEDLFGGSTSETSSVSFSIGTPEIGTRAFSDGATATALQYAVYDAEGNELDELTVTEGLEIHGSTTVELKLTTGNTYSVIFWAAAPGAPYTVDFTNKTMTVDYSAVKSNDENLDAFYKLHTFTVKGNQSETIELKRPFAQLNIGTNDYEDSRKAGYVPTLSAVTVKNIYNTLDLWTGAVDGYDEVSFDYAAIPAGEKFPVAGYDYLAMNYLLVAADKDVINVDFYYTESEDATAKVRTVGSVPVQRNYRTNLYGQLFTSDVDVNIVINPEYDEPAYEGDEIEIIAALGGVFDATGDIDMTDNPTIGKYPYLNIDHSMVLNMNGYNFTSGSAADYGIISRGGVSTINDANIYSLGGGLAVINGSEVTFNGGSLEINSTSTSHRYLFYVAGEGSKLTINGGNFDFNKTQNQKRAYIYASEGTTVYVNGGNFGEPSTRPDCKAGILGTGTVIIKGGTFGFDPSAWVAEGYKTITKDGKYYVVAEEIEAVATDLATLKDALANGDNISLATDIAVAAGDAGDNGYGAVGISQLNGGVIDGNGNAISVNAWGTWDSAINTTGGTIKNVNVTGGMRGIFISHNSSNNSKVILENVTIDGTVYTISCDQGTNNGLEAYNSTFNGWTSYAATIGDVTFTNCSFGEGQGYAFCRPYAPTVFTNCDFEAGFEIDARANVKFVNCRLDGVQLTSANIATLVIGGLDKVTVE